jgi:membrane protein YdbS with pleckstrin-like domain
VAGDTLPAVGKARTLRGMRDHPHDGAAAPDAHPDPSGSGDDARLSGAHAQIPEVWQGSATNRFQWLLAAIGVACLALGVQLAVDGRWTSSAVPLVMAVVGCVAAGLLVLFGTLAFVHVAVRVDREAVEVRCGHIGVPRRRIPLSAVVDVETAPWVTPRHWGGWGYRWRPEQGMAIVVRRGEAVVLTLRDGRTFTVTVDDAEGAACCIRSRIPARTAAS